MLNPPKTKEEARLLRQPFWGWVEQWVEQWMEYDESYCAYQIGKGNWWQCHRKPGHGPDGLYCKQHAKMVEGK